MFVVNDMSDEYTNNLIRYYNTYIMLSGRLQQDE